MELKIHTSDGRASTVDGPLVGEAFARVDGRVSSPFWTVPEVAEYLRRSERTIRRYCEQGNLDRVKMPGGFDLIDAESVDRFVAAHRELSTAECAGGRAAPATITCNTPSPARRKPVSACAIEKQISKSAAHGTSSASTHSKGTGRR